MPVANDTVYDFNIDYRDTPAISSHQGDHIRQHTAQKMLLSEQLVFGIMAYLPMITNNVSILLGAKGQFQRFS